MQNTANFGGLSLTQIFEIQSIQSLLIKFWYLGLTSDCLISKQDIQIFKTIKKTINFANSFTFEMPIKTYINFAQKIMKTLTKLQPKIIFDVLLGHLKNNKITTISFELFGVAFLQLFGKSLQYLNTNKLNQILRQIYIELTIISKSGTAIIKTDKTLIKQIDLNKYIENYHQLIIKPIQEHQKLYINPQNNSIDLDSKIQPNNPKNLKTLRGRLQSQAQLNSSMRQADPGQYPTGQKMKNKDKTSISCFMMGGFEIVDYSQSINQLHRKLLSKILLNK